MTATAPKNVRFNFKKCNYVLHLCIDYDIIIVQIKKGQPQRLEGGKDGIL